MSLFSMLSAEGYTEDEFAQASDITPEFEDAQLLSIDGDIRAMEFETLRVESDVETTFRGYTALADMADELDSTGQIDATSARFAGYAVNAALGEDIHADDAATMLGIDDFSALADAGGMARQAGATLRRIWEALKKAVRKAIEFLKSLWQKYFSASKKMNDTLSDLKKRIGKITDPNENAKIDVGQRTIKAMSASGGTDAAAYATIPKSIKNAEKILSQNFFAHMDAYAELYRMIADMAKDAKADNGGRELKVSGFTAKFSNLGSENILAGKGFKRNQKNIKTGDSEDKFTTIELASTSISTKDAIASSKGESVTVMSVQVINTLISDLQSLNQAAYSKDKAIRVIADERYKAITEIDKLMGRLDSSDVDKDAGESAKHTRKLINGMRDSNTSVITQVTQLVWAAVREGAVLISKTISGYKKSKDNAAANTNTTP